MTDALEWHRANLKRDKEQLAVMLAACGSEKAASGNASVIELQNRIALIEKILAANPPQRT
jgi:hypothetical protein